MTREEALQYLYDFRDNVSWDGMPEEALDMAIKALEQEPTANNDCAELNGCISCSLDDGDDCCRKLYEESMQEPITKNDLGVDCISRIETIDYLCKHCPDDGECFKDCDEIKHLRQMPSVTPQPCEDAVSRQAVLDLINADWKYEGLETEINNLPSVTPQEPKKGKWLMPTKNYSDKIWRKCSCCGTHLEKYSKYISLNGVVNYIENKMNYCPICGADMREVKE